MNNNNNIRYIISYRTTKRSMYKVRLREILSLTNSKRGHPVTGWLDVVEWSRVECLKVMEWLEHEWLRMTEEWLRIEYSEALEHP